MNTILTILYDVLLFLPLVFQIFFGNKSIKGSLKLKFWQISVISIISQVIVAIVGSYLMRLMVIQTKFHDGFLAIIGGVMFNIILGVIVLLVILKQTSNKPRQEK
ncbi:hypothetical protein Palpr_0463 [Paludibacter propionicigenes WB4]|uniref:Uncharacterized protein n=1 Tax=Paludibacter propionicigenes (strain DSM 17365 / JCM 13257 / WB4) TaxID=694427 RepID=E4T1M9_PALPW|nr:hypothetical protein Palpr_0463 [Paludibacter propionicigenes WB4]